MRTAEGIRATVLGAAFAAAPICACGLAMFGTSQGADATGGDATAGADVEGGPGPCLSCVAGGDSALVLDPRDSATDARREASTADAPPTAEDGSPDGASLACDTCLAQACPGAQAACGAGTDCAAYLACLILCGGSGASTCSTDCGSQHAAGQQASAMLALCTIICAASCNSGGSSSSGGAVDSGSADADDAGG